MSLLQDLDTVMQALEDASPGPNYNLRQMVEEAAYQRARKVNHYGLSAQVQFLLDQGLTVEEILTTAKEG
jgi:hypothetical protein